MTIRITLKPVEGRLVRHPDSYKKLEDGESVEQSSYWLRRLRDGDVILVEADAHALGETQQPLESDKGVKK